VPGLKPLVVSAPFGNYIQPDGCTATLGTFTAASRPGRLWRILKTVRYYPRLRAWVNKIGLRNPGIGWVENKVAAGKLDLSDKLVSVPQRGAHRLARGVVCSCGGHRSAGGGQAATGELSPDG